MKYYTRIETKIAAYNDMEDSHNIFSIKQNDGGVQYYKVR